MTPPKFGARSRACLDTLDHRLRRVVEAALVALPAMAQTEGWILSDFSVVCGWRSGEEQDRLYAAGRSQLRAGQSRHNHTDAEGRPCSLAVDLLPYPWRWPAGGGDLPVDDERRLRELAELVKHSARVLGVAIEWGGDWTGFIDMPHYQITT